MNFEIYQPPESLATRTERATISRPDIIVRVEIRKIAKQPNQPVGNGRIIKT